MYDASKIEASCEGGEGRCCYCCHLGAEAIKPPRDGHAAVLERPEELDKDFLGDVNVVGGAAHALVLDGGAGCLAVGRLDGDALAAHGVSVGLGAHEQVGEGDNVLRLVCARVVVATGAETGNVVRQLAAVA